MYKKITGVPENKDEARQQLTEARMTFCNYNQHLVKKKEEFQSIKTQNDLERDELKKQQRIAKQFKFTKMTKKINFLPSVSVKEYFKDQNSITIGTSYVDDRDKQKLCMPDRAFKKDIPKWNIQKTCDGDIFYRSTKQESECYDDNMLKFMRTQDRGITRPKPMTALTISHPDRLDNDNELLKPYTADKGERKQRTQSTWRATNPYKWTPNNFLPTLLGNTSPLLDGTHTPRGAKRAISLERTFDKNAWMYNRNTMENFNPKSHAMKNDFERNKILKKIIKGKKKSAHGSRKSDNNSSRAYTGFTFMNSSKGMMSGTEYA